MKLHLGRRPWSMMVLGLAVALLATASAPAAVTFTRVTTLGVGPGPNFGMTRTGNGMLHLVYQTTKSATSFTPTGLATRSISGTGTVGPQVQALSSWRTTRPGLVALPDGSLVSVFGAISPHGSQASGIWAVSSSDGGATWAPPKNVGSHSALEALTYGSDITMQMAGATPVLTMAPAGSVVVQRGLGTGSSTQRVTNSSDGFAGDVDSAADPASHEVVASWSSLAGKGGDYMQAVAPTLGKPQLVPGELRSELVISGRDTGLGVFAAYTTDNTHVRLLRYGGGSETVGKRSGVLAAELGTATGVDGRIWVMWGSDNGGVAVTRSNKAVTRFEPIQHVNPNAFTLYRLSGDGRLGPLDLFVDEIPTSKPTLPPAGTFHARVLPEPSAKASVTKVKTKKGKLKAYKLKVHVTDAGDPLSGATVAAAGKQATSNTTGVAKLKLPATLSGKVKVTMKHPGYRSIKKKVEL